MARRVMSMDKPKKVDPAQNSESCLKDREDVIQVRVPTVGRVRDLFVGSLGSFIAACPERRINAITKSSRMLGDGFRSKSDRVLASVGYTNSG